MFDIARYTLNDYLTDLRGIVKEIADFSVIFNRATPLARKLALARETWLKPEYYEADAEQGFTSRLLHEEPDHSLAVFAVAWRPERGTPPHDHGTWGIFVGVDGIECNIKYNRLDDGSRPGYAELQERCTIHAGPGDVICMRPGAIHAVRNDGARVSLSLHTYGRHPNFTGRFQYDLETRRAVPFIVSVS